MKIKTIQNPEFRCTRYVEVIESKADLKVANYINRFRESHGHRCIYLRLRIVKLFALINA
jgi:hypothetical protein